MVFSVLISFSQDTTNIDLSRIFAQTKSVTLPFNTKNIDLEKAKSLNKEVVFDSFLKDDTSKYYYTKRVYDNNLFKNVTKKFTYNYYSIGKFKQKNFKILIYIVTWFERKNVVLATCTNSNHIIDTFRIGYEKGGGNVEISEYTEGRIKRDLSIETKKISWNPRYSDKKNNEEDDIPKSVVKISHYKINDKTGDISYQNSEQKYSKCYPEQFTYDDTECEIFSSDSIQNPD